MREVSGNDLLEFLLSLEEDVNIYGDFSQSITGFCSLKAPKDSHILWVKRPAETDLSGIIDKKNLVVVTKEHITISESHNLRCVVTQEPKAVYFRILEHFWHPEKQEGIASDAVVMTKNIGKNVSIGHHCYIDKDVKIGDGTVIEHNVTLINQVVIGDNCFIHSGVVIGTDGFGYFVDHVGKPCKVAHYGGVRIGDEVEIGANTCIDRGTLDDTQIGSNTKIDNLVHIAHNVTIGDNVMVIAQSLVAGSCNLESGSYVAPGAVIKNQLTVGKNAFVGMGAVVTKDVEDNMVVMGVPATPVRKVTKQDK